MARIPRRDLIGTAEVGVYHCVQRAVRRAWLCGQDPVTGKNFDHRKVWIQERLAFLAGQFSIDICSIAIMSNHIHVVVRNRPDIAGQLSDEEVARRWWNLFPGRKTDDDKPAEPESHELAMLVADGEALHQRRQIPAELLPILQRLRLSTETWVETVLNFGRWFHLAAGRVDSLAAEAARRGRRWLQGVSHSRAAFA